MNHNILMRIEKRSYRSSHQNRGEIQSHFMVSEVKFHAGADPGCPFG